MTGLGSSRANAGRGGFTSGSRPAMHFGGGTNGGSRLKEDEVIMANVDRSQGLNGRGGGSHGFHSTGGAFHIGGGAGGAGFKEEEEITMAGISRAQGLNGRGGGSHGFYSTG